MLMISQGLCIEVDEVIFKQHIPIIIDSLFWRHDIWRTNEIFTIGQMPSYTMQQNKTIEHTETITTFVKNAWIQGIMI